MQGYDYLDKAVYELYAESLGLTEVGFASSNGGYYEGTYNVDDGKIFGLQIRFSHRANNIIRIDVNDNDDLTGWEEINGPDVKYELLKYILNHTPGYNKVKIINLMREHKIDKLLTVY